MDGTNGANTGRTAASGYNWLLMTIGWVSAIVSLVFYPFVFGVLGVIMGILTTRNRSRAGLALIVASILFMGVGLIYSPVLRNYIINNPRLFGR